jgi:hypothetical protein
VIEVRWNLKPTRQYQQVELEDPGQKEFVLQCANAWLALVEAQKVAATGRTVYIWDDGIAVATVQANGRVTVTL